MAFERGMTREGSIRFHDLIATTPSNSSHGGGGEEASDGELGFSLWLGADDSCSCYSDITDFHDGGGSVSSFAKFDSSFQNNWSNHSADSSFGGSGGGGAVAGGGGGFHLATPKTPWSMKGRRHVFVMPSLTEQKSSQIGVMPILDDDDGSSGGAAADGSSSNPPDSVGDEDVSFTYRSYAEDGDEDYDIEMPVEEEVVVEEEEEEESLVEEEIVTDDEESIIEEEVLVDESVSGFAVSDSSFSFDLSNYSLSDHQQQEQHQQQQQQQQHEISKIRQGDDCSATEATSKSSINNNNNNNTEIVWASRTNNKYAQVLAQFASLESKFLAMYGIQAIPIRASSSIRNKNTQQTTTTTRRRFSTGSINFSDDHRIFRDIYSIDDDKNMYPLLETLFRTRSIVQASDPNLKCQLLGKEMESRRQRLKDEFEARNFWAKER